MKLAQSDMLATDQRSKQLENALEILSMSNTNAQKKAAEWIRTSFLVKEFGQKFNKSVVSLYTGGEIEFNAVSCDGSIVGIISTSTPFVPNGAVGRGKLSKIRADALFLLMIDGEVERLLIYTDEGMARLVRDEMNAGKLPGNIKILYAPLPDTLQAEVNDSRIKASKELAGI